MIAFILRRLLLALLVVLTVMCLAFVLTRLSGDLAISIAGPGSTQADVEVIRKAYGLDRPVLVGHSDGASIAAIYGGSVQDHRMAGLVLMSPHFIVEDVTSASIAEIRKAYDSTDLRQRLGRWHQDGDATVHGWTDVWLTNDFRSWDLTEDLAYIRMPVLIVQGGQDQYGTMRQVEIAQEECYCPVEVLELPEAKHVPHREAPQRTLDAVADFIGRALAAQTAPGI